MTCAFRPAKDITPWMLLAVISCGLFAPASWGQTVDAKSAGLPDDYSCSVCHRKGGDLWTEATPVADETNLIDDVHWQKGLRCHDCHGGSPVLDAFKNHRNDPDFHSLTSRADVPKFCGRCHSNIEYMRRFNPSARTDQEAEYWTSGHGRRLNASTQGDKLQIDQGVATCINCHGGHGILAVKDTNSLVYPARVAETCAKCHADEKRMAGREYNGRALGHSQYSEWASGVHGRALMKKGDLSAPACNDCHGNHGAMPPGVDSVANACGTCHGKVAKLFAETNMKHKFQQAGLPGCATCHGAHQTNQPADEMLGMTADAVCARCHNPQNPQYGATVAGAEVARNMRTRLEQLKQEISQAEAKVAEAERIGMEITGPRFDLRAAVDALTNARTFVHSFKPGPMEEALNEGLKVTSEVKRLAESSLAEHSSRRIWLACSLAPILLVVGLLLRYIRTMPVPSSPNSNTS